MKNIIIATLLLCLSACGGTQFTVVKPDPKTGYFSESAAISLGTADIVESKPRQFEKYQELLVVTAGDFFREEMQLTGYFDRVIDFQELQRIIIKEGLDDEIPQIDGLIGMKKVSDHIGPFLWLRGDQRYEGNDKYVQLILTDPLTAEDVLIAEVVIDIWVGVFDNNTWYPLLNAVVNWIQANRNGGLRDEAHTGFGELDDIRPMG